MPQDSILSLNGLDHLLNKLDEKFDKKVDIVSGKGLLMTIQQTIKQI